MRVGIIGVTGYAGSELLRLLLSHGGVEASYITSKSYEGQPIWQVHPQFLHFTDLKCRSLSFAEARQETDLVFCALPHGEAMEVVPPLLEAGLKVIDLSADFRLDSEEKYMHWYGRKHAHPQYLKGIAYGLPELYREDIKESWLVANPGCYPTSAILALAPLAAAGVVNWEMVVVDAKSGTSGAGRVPSQALHFPDCAENFRAYKVARHQHTPEIEMQLGKLAGGEVILSFVPHLVPMIRGILSSVYLKLDRPRDEEEIRAIYEEFYKEESFVRLLPPGMFPETKFVQGSNFCDISFKLDQRSNNLIIFSAIDNLVKGAAGQAVQNMNLMLGFEEETGLNSVPQSP